jgi:transcriptional regulator with GAF, ATPase, and Fis domain
VTAEHVQEVVPVAADAAARDRALPDPSTLDGPLSETLDDFERLLIQRALSGAQGNIAEAARRLKTDRPNLYRRMKRLGIANDDA